MRIAEPVESIDLYATLAELAGLQLTDRVRSESLVPMLEGSVRHRKKAYLFHSRFFFENNTHQLAVRDRQWKLIAKVDGDARRQRQARVPSRLEPGKRRHPLRALPHR